MPVIDANHEELLQGETLVLDASQTYITNVQGEAKYEGINFKWVCPEALVAFCENVTDSQIVIYFANFSESNETTFENVYEFQIVPWWTIDGEDIEYPKSINVTWFNFGNPELSLTSTNPVLATKEATFSVSVTNWDEANAEAIDVDWSFMPNITDAGAYAIPVNASLTVLTGGFAWNTAYDLAVTVTSSKTKRASSYISYSFETAQPPINGKVVIDPPNGTFPDTMFTVTIEDWEGSGNVNFRVWSCQDADGTLQELLSSNWVNDKYADEIYLLNTYPIMVEIKDDTEETTWEQVAIELTITVPDPEEMLALIQSAISPRQQVSFMKSYVYSLDEVEDGISTEQMIANRLIISEVLLKDTGDLKDGTEDAKYIYEDALELLIPLLSNTQLVNLTLATDALSIIDNLWLLEETSKYLLTKD